MSFVATNWLSGLDPALMTPGEFRVLFHLCDCHTPDKGAFPTQAYLMDRCGLSNSGLNKCLRNIEGKGLVRRVKRWADATKRQMSTRYILGFEEWRAQEPTPLSGVGKSQKPTPLSGATRLHSRARPDSTGVETNYYIKEEIKGPAPATEAAAPVAPPQIPADFSSNPAVVADARRLLQSIADRGPAVVDDAPAWLVRKMREAGLIGAT